jgi:tetratricopeptide (TPR) repeat protein
MTEIETDASKLVGQQGRIELRHMRMETEFRRSTQGIEREERDKYNSMLWNLIRMDSKPKVSIMELVGPRGENELDYKNEESLKSSVDHYHRRFDRTQLVRVLKYYTVYLMQRARKEGDPEKQRFLIFKAIELCRMIVQYSPFGLNAEAETIVFGAMSDLAQSRPAQFERYEDTERIIFNIMKKLHFSPVDTNARMEMAEQMVRQSSYFDALVQYKYLLDRLPKLPRESDQARGRIYIKVGEIFQNLIDYVEEGPAHFIDARKLRSFIERYNRDFSERGKTLPRITNPNAGQIRNAIKAIRSVAIIWYQRALGVRLLGPRMVTKLVASLADNHMKAGQRKEALKVLHVGYRYWARVPEGIDSLEQRLEYLNLMAATATQLKQQPTVNFANQEMRQYGNRLADTVARRDAVEARKQALRNGEELSE